jgi:hypothetical protein
LAHDLYVGVDWSGKGGNGRARGLQVATCPPGDEAPTLVPHANGWRWRRDEVLELLDARAHVQRVLAGLDFAFSYPYCDLGTYFPGHAATPAGPVALWATVEAACAQAPWFHGGPFLVPPAPFAAWFVTQAGAGPHYQHRLRVTEAACKAAGANPLCTFHCVGAQVGTGSLAGMRVLHAVWNDPAAAWTVWPFQEPQGSRSTLVEVFPTLFQVQAGLAGRDLTDLAVMNAALAAFGSAPLATAPAGEDEADALLIAAALRRLDQPGAAATWHPAGLPGCPQAFEGWIFGA